MDLKLIRTEAQYQQYLAEVDELIVSDPSPESDEGVKLELLSLLIEDFEKQRFQPAEVDPVDAIIFRMEEHGLQQKDLVPYIGSKSKVSEILHRKRTLTLRMIRALNKGLGIPAKALLTENKYSRKGANADDISRVPAKEMARRGWLDSIDAPEGSSILDKTKLFFDQVMGQGVGYSFLSRTIRLGGSFVSLDTYALNAWLARIIVKSREIDARTYRKPVDPLKFMSEVGKLSSQDSGPSLAVNKLKEAGIIVVIEPHLPKTLLDGAAVRDANRRIIGLTLRHDRLDNFWFTLMHELAHVLLHLDSDSEAFIDLMESVVEDDVIENEANRYAKEALVPRTVWRRSDAYRLQDSQSVIKLAEQLEVHPAVVAGRIRWETSNYRKLSKLVGHGKVREQFV